jgi:putative membrane protein
MSDPRVFFAAERTLLAWVRSGLTVIALGFVVARFGLFLNVLAVSSVASEVRHRTHWGSSALGITLVILGAAAILAALYNHRVYVRSLPAEDVPARPMPWFTSFLSVSLAVIGLMLAAYLSVA